MVRLGLHLSLGPFRGRKIQPCFYGQETRSLLFRYLFPRLSALTLPLPIQVVIRSSRVQKVPRVPGAKDTAQASRFLCSSETALNPIAFCLGERCRARAC